jgi:peroxiredoxin
MGGCIVRTRFVLIILLVLFSWIVVGEAKEAPLFVLPGLDGKEYSLEDLRGQPVVLTFVSTNCVYCRQELTLLEKLYQEYRDKALLNILAIDMGDTREEVARLVQRIGVSFPVLLDTDVTVAGTYGVMYVPTTFFLDPQGNLVDGAVGAQREPVLRNKLDKILWFRGLKEAEVKNLIALTSKIVVLDIRKTAANPFPQETQVVYKATQNLEEEISGLNPQDVHLLLVSSNQEGLTWGMRMARAGFTRVYYQMVDVAS